MAGVSSQGTYFNFAGFTAHATSVTVSQGDNSGSGSGSGTQRQRVSAAWLGSDPNAAEPFYEIWQPDPEGEGRLNQYTGDDGPAKEVQISYIGQTMPNVGAKGQLVITGKLSFSFNATVSSSSVTAALDDIVRGEVSFRVK